MIAATVKKNWNFSLRFHIFVVAAKQIFLAFVISITVSCKCTPVSSLTPLPNVIKRLKETIFHCAIVILGVVQYNYVDSNVYKTLRFTQKLFGRNDPNRLVEPFRLSFIVNFCAETIPDYQHCCTLTAPFMIADSNNRLFSKHSYSLRLKVQSDLIERLHQRV